MALLAGLECLEDHVTIGDIQHRSDQLDWYPHGVALDDRALMDPAHLSVGVSHAVFDVEDSAVLR